MNSSNDTSLGSTRIRNAQNTSQRGTPLNGGRYAGDVRSDVNSPKAFLTNRDGAGRQSAMTSQEMSFLIDDDTTSYQSDTTWVSGHAAENEYCGLIYR